MKSYTVLTFSNCRRIHKYHCTCTQNKVKYSLIVWILSNWFFYYQIHIPLSGGFLKANYISFRISLNKLISSFIKRCEKSVLIDFFLHHTGTFIPQWHLSNVHENYQEAFEFSLHIFLSVTLYQLKISH